MQQFVSKILSVYMLLLALVPCTDTAAELNLNATDIVTHATADSTDHDHSNSCTDDTCPPFCICDCCSLVLGASQVVVIPLPVFTPKPATLPMFSSAFVPKGIDTEIWSPPRG